MIKIYLKILYILLIINKILTKTFSIKLPFKTLYEYEQINSPEKYFETKFFNEPITLLTIGTNHQSIPCLLSINTYTLYISGSNSSLKENQPKYEEFKSIKYQNLSNKYQYESTYTYGIASLDEIYLNNNDIITDLKFYLAKSKFTSDELIYSCIIGLGYEGIFYDYEDENKIKIGSFITQMKNNGIIHKKIFFINYSKNHDNINDINDNGEIIFGVYPHEIKNNYCDNCYEEDFIEIENNFIVDTDIIWSIKGYVYVGENKIYDYLSSIDFELNQGFIIGSKDYKEYIETNFFNEKISEKQCFKKEIYINQNIFETFFCEKNINLSKFENLMIYISKIKYEIKFTYKDIFLFDEKNNCLFFSIIFMKNEFNYKHDFVFGKPFFKKYPIVFNVEGIVEKIGFYYNLFVSQEKEKKDDKNREYKTNIKYRHWNAIKIFLISIGILIIGLLIYIIKKFFFKKKKKKVDELIEFFDYSTVK